MLNEKWNKKQESGQSVVELAIIFPVIVLFLAGIFEFGLYFLTAHEAQNAVRDGVRHAVQLSGLVENDPRIIDRVNLMLPDSGLFTAVNTTSTVPNCELDGDVTVTVTGTYNFTFLNILGINHLAVNIPTSMRHEDCGGGVAGIGGGAGGWVPGGGGGAGGGGGGGLEPICYELTSGHTGPGTDPVFSPTESDGCVTGFFFENEVVALTASPDTGWLIGGWSGTDDDGSTSETNQLTMPASDSGVSVAYVAPPCYILSLSKTGDGSVPAASPAKSPQCGNSGEYVAGESITLNANPDGGSSITGWSGTDDDGSSSNSNSLTMPASNHSASVFYNALACYSLSTSHTGNGNDPNPSAPNCSGGRYIQNTVVTLNAQPASGWEVGGWTNTDNDGSTSTVNPVTMTSDKSVSVTYVEESEIAPPLNVRIPNGPGDWWWIGWWQTCTFLDLDWSVNPAWAPTSPVKYEVFKGNTSWGYQTGTYWNSNFSVSMGDRITLGVRAIFPGGATSQIQEVTYACFWNQLVLWGSVIR